METDRLTDYRPRRVAEFVGLENQRRLGTVLKELRDGKWGGPLAIMARFGTGKTTAGRLLSAAVCCPAFPTAGEPCGACEACRSQRPEYNGDRHGRRHWEIDCSAITHRQLVRFCAEVVAEPRAVVFLDELAGLTDPADQRPLLKFCEEFRGVLLAAVTVDDDAEPLERKLIPPLAERFRQLRLRLPTEAELVPALADLARSRGIPASEPELRLAVKASGRKFRKCLQTLHRAELDGGLTHTVIGEALGLGPGWEDDLPR